MRFVRPSASRLKSRLGSRRSYKGRSKCCRQIAGIRVDLASTLSGPGPLAMIKSIDPMSARFFIN